jgi:excisionase family DNA binding protein
MLDNAIQTAAALTVEELAARIHYHPESVRRAIRQGRIHALPFGAGWRIPAQEVARILTTGLPYRAARAKAIA